MNAITKSQPIRSDKLRDSARGETCTFQIPGICNHNPETTVLCHLPDESHGMGRKSDDICAAFGCSACHDEIDRRSCRMLLTLFEAEQYMRRAQTRTLRRWVERGLVTLA